MDYYYFNSLSSTLTFKMLACLFLIFFVLLFFCPVNAAVYQSLTLSLPPSFLKNTPLLGWNQHTEDCPQSLQAIFSFPWLFWHFCLDITPFTNWQDPNYNHFLSYKPVSWHQYCLSCYSFTTLSRLILFILYIHLDIKSCHFSFGISLIFIPSFHFQRPLISIGPIKSRPELSQQPLVSFFPQIHFTINIHNSFCFILSVSYLKY